MTKIPIFFSILLGVVFAQVETTTSITGNVTDQQGAAFAGASVKLSNQNTGAIRATVTNSEGVYSFQSLPGGTYTISVSAKGFKTSTITDRTVETAQPAHVDLQLEIGSTSEQVTVSGAGAELVNTASAEVTGSVTPGAGGKHSARARQFLRPSAAHAGRGAAKFRQHQRLVRAAVPQLRAGGQHVPGVGRVHFRQSRLQLEHLRRRLERADSRLRTGDAAAVAGERAGGSRRIGEHELRSSATAWPRST